LQGDRLLQLSWPACVGCYAGIMTVTLHLDGAVAEALAVEAARRGQTAEQLAADLLAAQLTTSPRRRLSFAAVGASTSGRGAAEADEMLAEGFGRD
jgi:plasmid stability protein